MSVGTYARQILDGWCIHHAMHMKRASSELLHTDGVDFLNRLRVSVMHIAQWLQLTARLRYVLKCTRWCALTLLPLLLPVLLLLLLLLLLMLLLLLDSTACSVQWNEIKFVRSSAVLTATITAALYCCC
jgi:hypothetical protein